jgi:hypothetical protein
MSFQGLLSSKSRKQENQHSPIILVSGFVFDQASTQRPPPQPRGRVTIDSAKKPRRATLREAFLTSADSPVSRDSSSRKSLASMSDIRRHASSRFAQYEIARREVARVDLLRCAVTNDERAWLVVLMQGGRRLSRGTARRRPHLINNTMADENSVPHVANRHGHRRRHDEEVDQWTQELREKDDNYRRRFRYRKRIGHIA